MLPFTRINRNIRSLKRYRQVLGVLIKYGYGHVIEELNINYYLELGKRIVTLGAKTQDIERLTQPERLRLAMEELGPTFVKLGQILSTRPDLVPKEYTEEFRKLQDKVPAVDFQQIRQQIEKEFDRPISETFAEIDPEPIAAGSIAQVHKARLHSGEDVVVKVRRPGILKVLETDLDILAGLAYLVENHLPTSELYDPSGAVREFRRTIFREVDFTREGHTTDRFANHAKDNKSAYTPGVYWEQTGETVLTLEHVDGIKVTSFHELESRGLDRKKIAENCAKILLEQVLVHGLFHCDPHPGNIMVLPEEKICFLDYGMIGRLDDELKQQLAELLVAVLQRDAERIISLLIYSGELTEDIDRGALKRDITEFIDDYYDLPLADFNTGRLLTDFVDILTRYRIRFPADLILLAKALVTLEGVARQLDPEFNLVVYLKPQVEHLVRARLNPMWLSRDLVGLGRDYGSLIRQLPQDLRELIHRVNHNKFKIDLEHRGLERLITDLDKSTNRISFSMVIAALVIGSSLIMQTDKGPMLFGFPILGLLGYSIAAFLGLGLAIAILRSGRM
ncbi:MAG: AarF/ABC1/UbiB kinase family protein [Desulfuromonadales bacterium]|nr:AarF/ABC1/UbiB kinase family protein [Desulfuromonadales bacterium]